MSLLENAILSLCMSASSQTNLACNNAIQAGAKQSGFEQSTEAYERQEALYYESGSYNALGKTNAEAIGGTLWLTNAIVSKKASIGLPTLGLCDRLALEANGNESKLVFKWSF